MGRFRSLTCCLLPAAIVLMLAACDSAPPGPRQPQSRPADTLPAPVDSQPATTKTTTQPATKPAIPEPSHPPYLLILDRFRPHQKTAAEARVEPGRRLVIDTTNVRRMRIERSKLPMDGHGRIILRLDGQGILWPADSRVVEFERSQNGDWMPIRPSQRAKRRNP